MSNFHKSLKLLFHVIFHLHVIIYTTPFLRPKPGESGLALQMIHGKTASTAFQFTAYSNSNG